MEFLQIDHSILDKLESLRIVCFRNRKSKEKVFTPNLHAIREKKYEPRKHLHQLQIIDLRKRDRVDENNSLKHDMWTHRNNLLQLRYGPIFPNGYGLRNRPGPSLTVSPDTTPPSAVLRRPEYRCTQTQAESHTEFT